MSATATSGDLLTGEVSPLSAKDGQYLFIDPVDREVVVRTGTSEGGVAWIWVLRQLAART